MRCRFLVGLASTLAIGYAAAAIASPTPEQPLQEGPRPPAWTRTSTHCVVELVDGGHPAGVVGYIGYNVTELLVVGRRRVSCPRAKRYSRREWVHGPVGQPLRWRYVKAWRSTAGSAYVGDFKGRRGKRLVEYFAVH